MASAVSVTVKSICSHWNARVRFCLPFEPAGTRLLLAVSQRGQGCTCPNTTGSWQGHGSVILVFRVILMMVWGQAAVRVRRGLTVTSLPVDSGFHW